MNTDFIASFSFISSGDTLGTEAASSANGAAPSYIHVHTRSDEIMFTVNSWAAEMENQGAY